MIANKAVFILRISIILVQILFSDRLIIFLSYQLLQKTQMPKPTIKIGYFPLRGKAQAARLLCEFLEVNYSNQFYTYQEWMSEKNTQDGKVTLKQLPYLEEGKFRICGSIPICLYIIDRFGNEDLLGNSIADQGIVDMYLWTIDSMSDIINMNCKKKPEQQMKQYKEKQWSETVAPKLQKFQQFSKGQGYFLGYLTIIDFSIYELVGYIRMIFGNKVEEFPNLARISYLVSNIPNINKYENSDKCIKEMCPSVLLRQIRDNAISK